MAKKTKKKKVAKKSVKAKKKTSSKKVSAKKTFSKKVSSKKSKAKKAAPKKSKPKAKKATLKKSKPVVKKSVDKKIVQKISNPVVKKAVVSKPAVEKITKPVLLAPAPIKEVKLPEQPKFEPIPKPAFAPKIQPVEALPENAERVRYSDEELQEFKEIIVQKLEDSKRELINLQSVLNSANDHGTDDTANTFKVLEDGSDTLAKEEAGQLASRQQKFIEQLENALVRIENKTYGICRVTGKLIPKERLRAVPHTTQTIEAKLNQYKD